MAADGLQKRLQAEIEKYKCFQKELQKHVTLRQQLDSQLNENTLVLDELKILEADANVYKMIGPVLVKQDPDESKQNVQKRIDYITGEVKRHDTAIEDIEKKQATQREVLGKLQQQYQQQQVATATR